MNFLAHAFLAGDDPALIVGGVVGDWIKGLLPGPLPEDLARGVRLHRAIDRFAETHPAFRASRQRISAARRRYSGVLVDMFYDHLLARAWHDHHNANLRDYCTHVYALIGDRMSALPEPTHRALQMMAQENWLESYVRLEGIADVLARMSRRARQPNPLAGGEAEFLLDPDGFNRDFNDWRKSAEQFAKDWRKEADR
jgi:acyl carrier protein phosphodiesterase